MQINDLIHIYVGLCCVFLGLSVKNAYTYTTLCDLWLWVETPGSLVHFALSFPPWRSPPGHWIITNVKCRPFRLSAHKSARQRGSSFLLLFDRGGMLPLSLCDNSKRRWLQLDRNTTWACVSAMASSLCGELRVWAAKSIASVADGKLAELQLSRWVDRWTV